MRTLFALSVLLLLPCLTAGQLSGTVTTVDGEPLPFASVYLQNSTVGTSTNAEGVYRLKLEPGAYAIVFQYVGFETRVQQVTIGQEPEILDVALETESLLLEEVQITAGEDPAYEVIRKAQEKRKYYRDLVPAYRCTTYIKGQIKLEEAPEKILGQEVGDMDGLLDTVGQGIVYLSESESILARQEPDGYKEIMISSRLSGDDRGFSFNSALALSFSFYNNTLEMAGRDIVSPIASNAMAYYRYRLEGTFFDDDGRLVNRITVLPKRNTDPVFAGEIYIVEDFWNIHSARLFVTGSNIQNPILDTLHFQQVNLHVEDDVWVPFQKNIYLSLKVLGFRFSGGFTGVFRDYDIRPEFGDRYFNREIFRVESGANDKGVEYWDTIRPIPLTNEEVKDYHRRDSLEQTEDPDSLQRTGSFGLFSGFEYHARDPDRHLRISSPITAFQFNTVQGLYTWLRAGYSFEARQENEAGRADEHSITGQLMYGFADGVWRGHAGYELDFADYWSNSIRVSAGRYITHFHPGTPIMAQANSFYSLFYKDNYAKYYEWDKVEAGWRGEWFNGFYAGIEAGFSRRRALLNRSDYSFRKKEREYISNNPLDPALFERAFPAHDHHYLHLYLQFTPANRYMSFPGRKMDVGSPWPTFRLMYRKGIPVFAGRTDFDFISLGADDTYDLGVWGEGAWNTWAGMFLRDEEMTFVDYRHFDGNQTIFGDPSVYMRSFHLLPYYAYSTSQPYWEFHYQHAFNGFILDKVPLIRKLGLRSVTGLKSLWIEGSEHYAEVSFGLDNLGISGARFLRVDVVWQFVDGSYRDFGIMIGAEIIGAMMGDAGMESGRSVTIGL